MLRGVSVYATTAEVERLNVEDWESISNELDAPCRRLHSMH